MVFNSPSPTLEPPSQPGQTDSELCVCPGTLLAPLLQGVRQVTTCLGDIQCLPSTSLYEEEGSTHQDNADTYQGSWGETRIQYQLFDLNTDDQRGQSTQL